MADETYTPTATRTREATAYPLEREPAYEERQARKTEPMSVAAMILGVVGFVIPILPSALALLLGYPARKKIRADPYLRGDGMALTAIILGWVALGLYVLALLFIQFGAT